MNYPKRKNILSRIVGGGVPDYSNKYIAMSSRLYKEDIYE